MENALFIVNGLSAGRYEVKIATFDTEGVYSKKSQALILNVGN